MPHFSRLTDIVTCCLTEILKDAADPQQTLREILEEMEEGLASARRVAKTSLANRDRLQAEIKSHKAETARWLDDARNALSRGDEAAARAALTRKVEVEDLIEALSPEFEAARNTYQNMLRIQKALEARHAEAQRRMTEISGQPAAMRLESLTAVHSITQSREEKRSEVEAELEALRRQLGG